MRRRETKDREEEGRGNRGRDCWRGNRDLLNFTYSRKFRKINTNFNKKRILVTHKVLYKRNYILRQNLQKLWDFHTISLISNF
jgi:hypothetical protein